MKGQRSFRGFRSMKRVQAPDFKSRASNKGVQVQETSDPRKNSYKRRKQLCKLHGPVVQGVDNPIHWINHYPVDKC